MFTPLSDPIPVTPAPPQKPAPGQSCNSCGHKREVKMDTPGHTGKAPAKGTTKFRATNERRPPGRPRIRKRDYRYVEYY